MATVRNVDMWPLLLCTTRYSMGRASYVVAETCEMVVRYAKHLKPKQVEQIATEVETELDRAERDGKTLGHDMDHREWKRLVEMLRVGAEP